MKLNKTRKLKKKFENSRKLWRQNSRKLPKLKFSENPLTYFARQTAKKKPGVGFLETLEVKTFFILFGRGS